MHPYIPGSPPEPGEGPGRRLMHKLRELMPSRQGFEDVSRFRGIERLGGGCMGDVYRAFDSQRDELVALKVSKGTTSSKVSFENEVRALTRINHTNVVRLLDSGIFSDEGAFGGRQFLIMNIIEGVSLKDRLAMEGRVGWPEARHVLMQLCDALSAVHEAGIIHRDVKPDNVMISQGIATLFDFGVSERMASRFSIRHLMGSKFGPGNLDYTAPEVVNGRCDGRTDIFSLGMVMRHMLSGKALLNDVWLIGSVMGAPQEPIRRDAEIPEAQFRIISRAIDAGMDKRFQTASEMKAAIAGLP